MENPEFKKSIAFRIKDKLNYISNTIVTKYILNEKTGNIMAMAIDYGKVYIPKTTPFSTFVQVIEGEAEVVINEQSTYLQNGDCMIIPGSTPHTIEANRRFKMLSVILKSGYDE
ncbi:cupin domain-containing protein [Sinomicrobium soli]|uniref:cupin domain-containing protein n=1 Tax=Sinomicrobium sp. N-1-3-6 TaxID=2219864 RepID=UPI000DCD5C44|nr:cupin domain-containing protein [Sinomicrobium sp. N-1-3-6]RAV30960.1 cupin [Sinomicrobium sp. N-1-3-6]